MSLSVGQKYWRSSIGEKKCAGDQHNDANDHKYGSKNAFVCDPEDPELNERPSGRVEHIQDSCQGYYKNKRLYALKNY
jgi:hypothetical protein